VALSSSISNYPAHIEVLLSLLSAPFVKHRAQLIESDIWQIDIKHELSTHTVQNLQSKAESIFSLQRVLHALTIHTSFTSTLHSQSVGMGEANLPRVIAELELGGAS